MPFSVATGLRAGVSRGRLRHPSLHPAAFGLRTPGQPQTLAQAARALALVLPQPWAWSRETAAELVGLPVPEAWHPGLPLSVIRPQGSSPVRRPEVRGHLGLERRGVIFCFGMPVVDPFATWCDLAAYLDRDAAVIIGDAIAARSSGPDDVRMGRTALARLAEEVRRRSGSRGACRARTALALVREGSRSPMETRARLCFLEAGLPEPELNATIDDDGEWVAIADFVWRRARVIVEYQGDHHRVDKWQWRADIGRLERLRDLGWKVILMTAADLASREAKAAFVGRLHGALGADGASLRLSTA